MIEAFKKYVGEYDLENKDIKLKYNHSFRVYELGLKYAEELCLDSQDIYLAGVIGLLHDIGRFEQLKVYNTYNDEISIDHADYSVEQLFDKGEIRKFHKNEKDYEIIKQAIKNHNKYEITNVSDDRTLIHCHLIRDIDKVDILYNWACLGDIKLKEDESNISFEVMEDIRNKKTVLHKHSKTQSDKNVSFMALIFDVHYVHCLEECKKYIDIQFEKIKDKEKYIEVKKIIDQYVNERTGNYVGE